MDTTENRNPLLYPQREKVGAVTFSKYDYQYHWALSRALKEHERKNEYAIFVELHEDVVLAKSLSKSEARFEFSQIKTNQKKLSSSDLVRLKNGSSILGKLLSTCTNKPFSNEIDEINLVALNGFNITLTEDNIELDVIMHDDIHTDDIENMKSKLKKEINCSEFPKNIQFIIPDLPGSRFQDVIIAEIAKLISNLFPTSYSDPVNIYRALIDDLHIKGMITYDYANWEHLLKKKSLTSTSITKTINISLHSKNDEKLREGFKEISNELGLNMLKRDNLEKSFERYRQTKIGSRSTLQLDTTKKIKSLIREYIEDCSTTVELIEKIELNLPTKISNQFNSLNDKKAAIICEYLMKDENE